MKDNKTNCEILTIDANLDPGLLDGIIAAIASRQLIFDFAIRSVLEFV
jgi:hypothetical protein